MTQAVQDNLAKPSIAQRFVYPTIKSALGSIGFSLLGVAGLALFAVNAIPVKEVASVVDAFTRAGNEFTARDGTTLVLSFGQPDADGCQTLTVKEKPPLFSFGAKLPQVGKICPTKVTGQASAVKIQP